MNVTQIISDTNIGGGGRALLNYLEHCNRTDFVPSVILPRNSALTPRIQALQVPFYEIDAMADRSFDKHAFKPLALGLKKFKPQVVHTHGSLVGRMVATWTGKKVVYTKHCAFAPTGWKASSLGKSLVSTVDKSLAQAVLAVGHSAEENLLACGIPQKRIHTLYNGVTALPLLSQEERTLLRQGYGFSPDDFVVGMLARVETYKGHTTLLESAEILHKNNIPIKLLIAGDGDFFTDFQKQCKNSALPPDTVHFTGFVTQVVDPLTAMDVQVNASYESETSCLSLLEGMSIGLPAVASDCGGNPYLIKHQENGLVFPMQHPQALAKALETLYHDKPLYRSLQEGAKIRYTQEFTANEYAKKIETIYSRL